LTAKHSALIIFNLAFNKVMNPKFETLEIILNNCHLEIVHSGLSLPGVGYAYTSEYCHLKPSSGQTNERSTRKRNNYLMLHRSKVFH